MSPTKDEIVSGISKVALIGSALWLFSRAGSLLNVRGNAESFHASGSSSKLMTEKAAIHALTTAKGKFMTVTFLKKDGTTRRMRCRTGVKRYVKGVGSPLGTPSNRLQKYKLITVYDLDKAGYRSIPVDRVISVKAAGKTFSSKNPKGKQMSAEEYNSYNAEWEAIFETFGRRGYFADLSDDETEGMSDNEIMELVMDEGDLGWEEEPELIPDVLERHAESFEVCEYCGEGGGELVEMREEHISGPIVKVCEHCYDIARLGAESFDAESAGCSHSNKRLDNVDEQGRHTNWPYWICPDCDKDWEYDAFCPQCGKADCPEKNECNGPLAAESFAADSGPGILTKEEFDVLMGRVDSMTMNELYMIRHQIHSRMKALGMDFNKYSAESFEARTGFVFPKREAWPIGDRQHAQWAIDYMEDGKGNPAEYPKIRAAIKKKYGDLDQFEAPYVGAGALMDIGKDTALGSFSPSELATSSAIHGDFDQASLNYSGKQNLEVRAESDRDEDEEDYEEYLRLQGLCECTACGDISALSTGTTDKQGLYRCVACVTAKQPSISEEEIVEDMDYLRGTY